MRWTIALVDVATLALPAQAAAQDTGPQTEPRRCGQIGFTPGSDDVAARVRATGLTGGPARGFVRDSEGRPGRRLRGLTCTSTPVEDATPPHRRYRWMGRRRHLLAAVLRPGER
jgi:hypothetical protein